ncbi:MAG: xanthine dehydrogenase, partial [Caldilineaceae bacterium]|nr:xanthine dehydrogenase [Caldilineaceae bacterium]
MHIQFTVNGEEQSVAVLPGELLRTTLRRLRFYSVKHGDETGETGADAVLLTHTPDDPHSYRLVNSGVMLAGQADGAAIITGEGLSGPRNDELHPLQEEFVQCGAIQCGFCTPAQLLAAKKLLDENPRPSEAEVRKAIAG